MLGFLISLLLWAVLVLGSLRGALYLYRGRAIAEKWLLLSSFLFASLLFFAVRYRLVYWFFPHQTVWEFFGPGAFWELDRIAFFLCIPIFYALSVLWPDWVRRVWVSVLLLVFLPFAIKLFFYLTGIVGWDHLPVTLMPTRLD